MEIEVNLWTEPTMHRVVPWCERLMHFHEPLPPSSHTQEQFISKTCNYNAA